MKVEEQLEQKNSGGLLEEQSWKEFVNPSSSRIGFLIMSMWRVTRVSENNRRNARRGARAVLYMFLPLTARELRHQRQYVRHS